MSYPATYRYTKEHEWILVEGDRATIGITDHAQHELGDIVFVDLPKEGAAVAKGHTFGSVESVKAVSDIYSPVSGKVLEANDLLKQTPNCTHIGHTEAILQRHILIKRSPLLGDREKRTALQPHGLRWIAAGAARLGVSESPRSRSRCRAHVTWQTCAE